MRTSLQEILASAIVIMTVLPVHEFAHAYIANRLGDPTAKNIGRMTLNPLRHLDPFGCLLILFTGFGWAKPVPIDPRYFKNPKRGMAISALAGPVSNIILSAIVMILARLLMFIPISSLQVLNILQTIFDLLLQIAITSIYLGVFNMIPIPPLDGSRILLLFLPQRLYFKIMQYERYIMLAMIVLVLTGVLSGPLTWISRLIFNGLCAVIGL